MREGQFRMTIFKQFVVQNSGGWHARPCALIVKTVTAYPNLSVVFSHPEKDIVASGTSLFQMMVLAIERGDIINIAVSGQDEAEINHLLKKLENIISQPNIIDF